MKVKYKQLIVLFVSIIIIFECYGFKLLPIPIGFYSYGSLPFIFFVLLLSVNDGLFTKKKFRFIAIYYLITFIFLIYEMFYTNFLYRELSIGSYFGYAKYFLYIYIVFGVLAVFLKDNNIQKSMDVYCLIGTVALGTVLLHSVLYNVFGIQLLKYIDLYMVEKLRAGRVRYFDITGIESLIIIYSFYKLLYFKDGGKIKYSLYFLISILTMSYVQQSRALILMIGLCCVMMFVAKQNKTNTAKLFKWVLVFTILGIFISVFLDPLLQTFSSSSVEYGISTRTRIIELQYVSEVLKDKGLLGIGLLPGFFRSTIINRGIYINVAISDIGILGQLITIGFWIVPLYIYPIYRMAKITINYNGEDKVLLIGLLVFLIISSATIIVFDPQRFLAWPFCLAIFEFFSVETREKTLLSKRNTQIVRGK